jgi:hypothetical protein
MPDPQSKQRQTSQSRSRLDSTCTTRASRRRTRTRKPKRQHTNRSGPDQRPTGHGRRKPHPNTHAARPNKNQAEASESTNKQTPNSPAGGTPNSDLPLALRLSIPGSSELFEDVKAGEGSCCILVLARVVNYLNYRTKSAM